MHLCWTRGCFSRIHSFGERNVAFRTQIAHRMRSLWQFQKTWLSSHIYYTYINGRRFVIRSYLQIDGRWCLSRQCVCALESQSELCQIFIKHAFTYIRIRSWCVQIGRQCGERGRERERRVRTHDVNPSKSASFSHKILLRYNFNSAAHKKISRRRHKVPLTFSAST